MMDPPRARYRYAALLIPLSMLLLSVLRCGQFIAEHGGNPLNMITFPIFGSKRFDLATYSCVHSYSIELLSIDPLAIYINNFLTGDEINHLLNLTKNSFTQSLVTTAGPTSLSLNQTVRLSQTAFITEPDPVTNCLTDRMRSLLGNVQHAEIESLQIVKYQQGGDRFRMHTDWFDPPTSLKDGDSNRQSNRLGSVFAYLEDDCTRGETFFPELPGVSPTADGDKFALPDGGKGLLVKPRRGNAVFWNNLHANGSGDLRTAHAGLQVEAGVKIGLNIWSSYFFDLPMVGGGEDEES